MMPAPEFAVRPFRESDLDEWLRLRKLLWDENGVDEHREEMVEILSRPESQLVLVADGGANRLIGFLEASIRPFVEDCETDQVGYLEGWFAEPDYRMNGIGRALVNTAELWARHKGCTEMASDAVIGNDGGIAAHRRLGYQETSRLVHLRKELN